jgi:hypothetical protein
MLTKTRRRWVVMGTYCGWGKKNEQFLIGKLGGRRTL